MSTHAVLKTFLKATTDILLCLTVLTLLRSGNPQQNISRQISAFYWRMDLFHPTGTARHAWEGPRGNQEAVQ